MTVFKEYARYYDLLYKDKDYAGEARYVDRLIQSHTPGARSALNLGCGSGRHDLCLAEQGYTLTGVDFSEAMLLAARSAAGDREGLKYLLGDIRSIRLGETFNVVLSLFHVMSYQVTNADIKAAFATARQHLNPEGIFIFDCWYGPGVLTELPTVRVKDMEDGVIKATRIAEPVLHPALNVVDVNYRVFLKEKATGRISEISEVHNMRYFFLPELGQMLASAGFELVESQEWMTGEELRLNSWNITVIARAV